MAGDVPQVTLREYFEKLINERYNQYDFRFRAQEVAVAAALAAQDKHTAAAFVASEKAIIKAEEAQREYNIRSNEFRGQLDDQAKMLMPRSETMTLFKSLEEKVEAVKAELHARLSSLTEVAEKNHESIFREIAGLRESRSAIMGEGKGGKDLWGWVAAGVSILVAMFAMLRPWR